MHIVRCNKIKTCCCDWLTTLFLNKKYLTTKQAGDKHNKLRQSHKKLITSFNFVCIQFQDQYKLPGPSTI